MCFIFKLMFYYLIDLAIASIFIAGGLSWYRKDKVTLVKMGSVFCVLAGIGLFAGVVLHRFV